MRLPMRITIDKNLMDLSPPNKAITVLKRWMSEGKLELFEADPPPERRAPSVQAPYSPTDYKSRSKVTSKTASGKTSFAKLAPVLFPFRDRSRLTITEVNDVAHIARHSQSGNELFVTENEELITKKERLALHGVVAVTPDEAVAALSKAHGWK